MSQGDDAPPRLPPRTYTYNPQNPETAAYLKSRYIITHWLSALQSEWKLLPSAVEDAMRLLDRCILTACTQKRYWQKYAAVCLAIAVKNGQNPPRTSDLRSMKSYAWATDDSISVRELLDAEADVLNFIGWDLGVIRPFYPVAVSGAAKLRAPAINATVDGVLHAAAAVAMTDDRLEDAFNGATTKKNG